MIKEIENQILVSHIEGKLEHRERYLSEPDDWIRASDYIAEVRIREAHRCGKRMAVVFWAIIVAFSLAIPKIYFFLRG
ncbi:MAG: hypothetical protein ACRDD8_15905 [Bacteroidales bacterium]